MKVHFPNRRYICREWKSQRRTSKKLEPQPAETKEDAEARNDLWSIEGDFTYRHRTETRFHLYVPKEESFPISILTWPEQLTQIWMWCKKNVSTTWWNVDMGRNLIRFMDSIHEVHVTERENLFQELCGLGANYKHPSNHQTWLSVAWNLDWHVMGSGITKARQRSKTERHLFYGCGRWRASRDNQERKIEIGSSKGSGYACKMETARKEATGNCSEWEHQLSQENQVCVYCGRSGVHKEACGTYSFHEIMRITSLKKGFIK